MQFFHQDRWIQLLHAAKIHGCFRIAGLPALRRSLSTLAPPTTYQPQPHCRVLPVSFPILFFPQLRPFGHGVSHRAFVKKCLAELDQVLTALHGGCIVEHRVSSTLMFGYYQCRQDAWLLGLASYEDLGLETPVIGTGACVNRKRPTVTNLQFLVLLTLFHSCAHIFGPCRCAVFFLLRTFFSVRWLFRRSTKYAKFTALLRRLKTGWTAHDAEFWL